MGDRTANTAGGDVVADLRESLRQIVRQTEKLDHESCEDCYGAACIANGALARSEPRSEAAAAPSVLGVMAAAEAALSAPGDEEARLAFVAMRRAREAVAELIDAAKEVEADAATLGMEIPRLRAAIAKAVQS